MILIELLYTFLYYIIEPKYYIPKFGYIYTEIYKIFLLS